MTGSTPRSRSGVDLKKFSDPFILPSSSAFPSEIKESLDLCLTLSRLNPLYMAVVGRVASYFMTALEIGDKADYDQCKKLTGILTDTVDIFMHLRRAGDEWGIYGNAFCLAVEPFDRYLVDTRRGRYMTPALSLFPRELVEYDWETMKFEVPDLAAANYRIPRKRDMAKLPKVKLPFRDKPSGDLSRFSIIFLDPRYTQLDKPHFSNRVEYVYTIPPETENRVKTNVYNEIANMPEGLLRAVSASSDFRFHHGEVYHFRAPTPTGVSDSGWGLPNILWHFDTIYQLQVYRKSDQAIALDYMTPFRMFTPGESAGGDISTAMAHMLLWKQEMAAMIANRRKDPTSIHAVPYKVQYDEFCGNGKTMVLHEVLEYWTNTLFDGLGFPQELFRGSINVEQLPNAVRMFERHYEWMYQGFSGLLEFITSRVQKAMDMVDLSVKLKRPTVAHNAEWFAYKMQLAANQEIPRGPLFDEMGLGDPVDQATARITEDQQLQRNQIDLAKKFEQEQAAGSMADVVVGMATGQGGGAAQPAQAGGAAGGSLDYAANPSDDPTNIQERAQQIAAAWQQMHEQQPNSHRKEMQRCEAVNPTLYAAAKDAMDKLRAKGESAGRQQAAQFIGA